MHLAPIILALSPLAALQDAANDSFTIRVQFVHPEQQLREVLNLFEGTKAKHPAALLAAWRRATHNPDVLDKVTQAAIASLNPDMLREWSLLHHALGFWDSPQHWCAAIPNDDGTFAAFATALALTDGAEEAPLAPIQARVDRLGKQGAPLLAQHQNQVVVASSRAELLTGFRQLATPRAAPAENPAASGVHLQIKPGRLRPDSAPWLERLTKTLSALEIDAAELQASIQNGRVQLVIDSPTQIEADHPIDPAWLAIIPNNAAGAFSLSRDSRGQLLTALRKVFESLARNPENPPPSPLKPCLESILIKDGQILWDSARWDALRGSTGFVVTNHQAEFTAGALVLHMADPQAASDFAPRIARVARQFIAGKPQNGPIPTPRDTPLDLGEFDSRPVRMFAKDAHILISWGDLDSRQLAARLTSPPDDWRNALPSTALEPGAQSLFLAWPGRLPIPGLPRDGILARALAESPPVVARGGVQQGHWSERITWDGARGFVQKLTEILPQQPPENGSR